MKTVALGEIANINPRLGRTMASDEPVSFVPMAYLSDQSAAATPESVRPFGEVAKGYTPMLDGDLLVAKITPCFENGKIGQAQLTTRVGMGSTEFHVVRPSAEIDARYLLHFLRTPRVNQAGRLRMTGSGGQRRVPAAYLEELGVPLPPIDEQRRIAAIFDKVAELRDARLRTIDALGDLAKQAFQAEIAGERGWPTVTIGELATARGAIRTGPFGSQLLHSEFVDEGVAVLGIDNAVTNEFRWAQRRFITEEKYRQLKRYTVHPGDVIITLMGTCGRTAVVPSDIPLAINTKHLCCITPDDDKCLPEFLHASFLWQPLAQSHLKRSTKGGIMDGLNMGIIKEVPVLLAPLDEQLRIVDRLGRQRASLNRARAALDALDRLHAALQVRAFKGGL